MVLSRRHRLTGQDTQRYIRRLCWLADKSCSPLLVERRRNDPLCHPQPWLHVAPLNEDQELSPTLAAVCRAGAGSSSWGSEAHF